MRIAINALLLSGRYSGVEKAIYALLRHIGQGAGAADEIVALVGRDFDPAALDGRGIAVQRLPVSNRPRLLRVFYEEHALPRHLGGFDLLHAPAYVAPRRLPIPLVLTLYDLIALRHPELARRANVAHYRLRLPGSARAAARILVPTECVARHAVDHLDVPRDRIAVVPLGVDDDLRPPDEAATAQARRRYGLDEPFVLFVGNIEPKKNLPTLLRAVAALRRQGLPHGLVLAGKRGWKCRDVYRLPCELGIERAVRFLGYVPEAHLPGLYGAADLFAFPSLVEGFGLPPLEAMACGTPVVTSDAEALLETTGEAALHAPARDAEALADAMGRALTDAALRERLRAAGLARAAEFSWPRTAEATRAAYREALG